jgi:trypsin-like peptidase
VPAFTNLRLVFEEAPVKRKVCFIALAAVVVPLFATRSTAEDKTAQVRKLQERYTISLELEFRKKKPNTFQRAISVLDWGPNGYASGFLVGDGLVMTAYHVVSGQLNNAKKAILGFAPDDELKVSVYVNGCQANVVKVDESADLALLTVCRTPKATRAPAFQTELNKDEKLLLIARPHGDRIFSEGNFYGAYSFRGQQYWSAKIDPREGYSGSPVYNQKAELVGVFSGYDWSQKLALISPGARAQKLLEEYVANPKP